MRTPLLELRDVSLQFGGIKALEGVGFAVERGQIYAVIGPNELLEGTRQIDDPRSGE